MPAPRRPCLACTRPTSTTGSARNASSRPLRARCPGWSWSGVMVPMPARLRAGLPTRGRRQRHRRRAEVPRRPDMQLWRYGLQEKPKGKFVVLPKRWIMERTFFAWLDQSRRLSKDYKRLPHTSEIIIYTAMTRIMVRRIARPHNTARTLPKTVSSLSRPRGGPRRRSRG